MKTKSLNLRKTIAVLTAFAMALCILTALPQKSYAETQPNLEKATAAYGIDEANILTYSESEYSSLKSFFGSATDLNTDTELPVIAYIPSGEYHIENTVTIPENVIMVAEADTVFKPAEESSVTIMFMLKGSVYGGYYDGCDRMTTLIKSKGIEFAGAEGGAKQINGNVEYTEICNVYKSAIQSIGSKGMNICHNSIHDGLVINATGIALLYEAEADNISYNTVTNLGAEGYGSGISLSHADAVNINSNTVKNVAGHGISTDTDQNKTKDDCRIKNVKNNTIAYCGKHGVWLEAKCQITGVMSGNKIKYSGSNGVAASGIKEYNVAESGCKYSIASMSKNTIAGSKRSNMSLTGKYGLVNMTSSNVLSSADYANCITVDTGGKLLMTGKSNVIKNNKAYGVYLKNGSTLKITGKDNKICKNKKYAIGLYNKSTAIVKYAYLKKNTKGSAYVGKGSTFKASKCTLDKVYKAKTK